ncbi:MAG: hypothetical protein D6705_04655 [Deltaproteobacteria bacterium]|nr:MAG: hypothetical protein D6705_04655 [Deltaproteobacteria bacterium]
MDARAFSQRIEGLAQELRGYHGHRTVWIDLDGSLVHAEPEEELERRGYLYVGTFLRPSADELAEAAGRFVALAPSVVRPAASVDVGIEAGLAPA